VIVSGIQSLGDGEPIEVIDGGAAPPETEAMAGATAPVAPPQG